MNMRAGQGGQRPELQVERCSEKEQAVSSTVYEPSRGVQPSSSRRVHRREGERFLVGREIMIGDKRRRREWLFKLVPPDNIVFLIRK